MASNTLSKIDHPVREFDYDRASKDAGVKTRISSKRFMRSARKIASFVESNKSYKVVANYFEAPGLVRLSELNVDRIEVGGATYLLRTPANLESRVSDSGYEALIGGLEAVGIVGVGDSVDTAKSKLFHEIHRYFQRLYKTQPMQRCEQNEAVWQVLSGLIDVEQYKQNRSSFVKCSGQVTDVNERGIVFDWSGGSELNLPNQVLEPAWGKVEVGDWCDAVIERRAFDWKILRAIFMGKFDPPKKLSAQESKELWDSLPIAKLHPYD